MKKRSCDKCDKTFLNRAACIRKADGLLIHAGQCGGDVREEILPDIVARLRRKKKK